MHPPRAGVSVSGGRDVISAPDVAGALIELAERIARLRPISSYNPHAFYEERSEIAHDARSIAEWHRTGRKPG